MTDIAKSITDKLAELGDDADSIAAKLLELGYLGGVNGGSCPLYQYLHTAFPEVGWVSAEWVLDSSPSGNAGRLAELPPAHREFVDRFDCEGYPELYPEEWS